MKYWIWRISRLLRKAEPVTGKSIYDVEYHVVNANTGSFKGIERK